MNLNGGFVQKNPIGAYCWFYAAWSLADYDGLNVMGVLFRNGNGIARDLPLAQAPLMPATAGAKAMQEHGQSGNFISPPDQNRVAVIAIANGKAL